MDPKTRSVLLWILSFVLMVGFAAYQRMTGPTYPLSGKMQIEGQQIKYKLPRSEDNDKNALVKIELENPGLEGFFHYKRFKSHDEWSVVPMQAQENMLIAYIPMQPAAGKVAYKIELVKNGNSHYISKEDVIIRFKGAVPAFVLIPHILFMFLAMVFSIRTGFEALANGKSTFKYTWLTMVLLFLGGLIFGPIVQKYAFDAFWTGWPWGHDLTDNKTLFAFIFWAIAFFVLRKNKENRVWPIVAAMVLLAIYLIPHSVLGSEIDYTLIENAQQ
jgi:hypothetical protein